MSRNKYQNQTGRSKRNKEASLKSSPAASFSNDTAKSNASQQRPSGVKSPIQPLQPEQMSLEAYRHIQECLQTKEAAYLQKEDVTAVVQLAQHLRVFGLLSAVGYVRHAREGKIRERIRPMWLPLLWRLVCGDQKLPSDEKQARQTLMNATYTLSTQNPKGYMVKWRQALKLSNHWNFWARACQVEDANESGTEDSNTAS
ncbi:hypothetical protein [Almyronema epifaneia]|uniref:Uncharacterized protein n=1 Tax=Almyronema epifaneia S1 TaxID=2991925 RepID=A0ABW6IKC2_9CYAN